MITHYQGSRGLMAIDEMPYPYLVNARDKLVLSQIGNARQDEIDAMSARIKALDAEREEALRIAEEAAAVQTADIETELASAALEGF